MTIKEGFVNCPTILPFKKSAEAKDLYHLTWTELSMATVIGHLDGVALSIHSMLKIAPPGFLADHQRW